VTAWIVTAVAIMAITLAALIAYRWFRAYRYTDAWRQGEFRATVLSFLVFFGGLFGHRVPPPPQARIESIASGPPPFPDEISDKEP
jgi:hypothetical protein